MSLKLLLDQPEQVLSRWPTEPIRAHRPPSDFAHLLTMAEVQELVDSDCLALRNIALLKDGKVIDKGRYAEEDDDMPRRGAVREHLDAGGTISLRQLERLRPAIAQLQQALHAETGYLTHINGYLTPPDNQGLKYHFDPYVTLILQISGRKTWPLHRPFVENPVRAYGSFHLTGFSEEQKHFLAFTPPEYNYILEPGDVLWLPRGWVHSPYTDGADSSLHLTVAFVERTHHWVAATLVSEILAQALADPAMRAAVPPEQVTGDPADAVRDARKYLVGALLATDESDLCDLVRSAACREA
jgi:ribosomal protein L16 Arg81 hydroxylase